jgi:hypothetical protein
MSLFVSLPGRIKCYGVFYQKNRKKVAQGRIEQTQPVAFSGGEGADVGEDGGTPVVEDYGIPAPYKFTGKIDKVTINLKEMKTADKEKEDIVRQKAAMKKALSDLTGLLWTGWTCSASMAGEFNIQNITRGNIEGRIKNGEPIN